MLGPFHYRPAAPVPAVLPVNLAAVDAAHLLRILPLPASPLMVDCGILLCQRTQGVCFLVSQLLLRRGGHTVWLRNASPALRRCLRVLQLSSVLRTVD